MTRSEYFQTCSSADSGVAKTTVFLVALLRLAMLFHCEEGKPVAADQSISVIMCHSREAGEQKESVRSENLGLRSASGFAWRESLWFDGVHQ